MLDLFDYQNDGVAFLRGDGPKFLADQPGLGKTAQFIKAVRGDAAAKGLMKPKICVVAPKSSLFNWRREFQLWWPGFIGTLFPVNYEQLVLDGMQQDYFNTQPWDYLGADEAHRLKNSGALRTKAFYRRSIRLGKSNDTKTILLSGTPARNHAAELWTHIVACRPDLITSPRTGVMTLEQFETKYCRFKFDQYGARTITGSKNMSELREILIQSGFFLRRMKADVLSDLPPLVFGQYALSLNPQKVQGLGADFPLKTRLMDDEELLEWLEGQTHIATEQRLLGTLKADPVAEWVNEELQAPGKIIVFYKHREVGDRLQNQLVHYKPARVDGRTKDPASQVDQFQHDDKCQVFLGQITACGEALNLTKATQIIFCEASWSPSDNYQAACRGHRIGMQDSLTVRFAHVEGTLDEVIQSTLARKTAELAAIFD